MSPSAVSAQVFVVFFPVDLFSRPRTAHSHVSLFLCSFSDDVKPVEQRMIMSHMRSTSTLGASLTTSTSHYTSSRSSNSPSIKALQLEYSKLQKEPVEGFTVQLDESNLCRWHGRRTAHARCLSHLNMKRFFFSFVSPVGIFGPPDTLYEGGYFKADMEFPNTYPFAPPKVKTIVFKWRPFSSFI